MKTIRVLTCLVLLLIITVLSFRVSGQNTNLKPEDSENLYKLVEDKYGDDQILINGKYFVNIYRNDLGHPYFLADEFKKGYLIIHNQKYDGILLKYNIWNQTVQVLHTNKSNSEVTFIPPVIFISEYAIDGHTFKKYKFNNEPEQFFEELYSGEITALCYWGKDRDKSEHNRSFMAHKFSEPHKKLFLIIENSKHYIKNKNALLKLFPKHKKSISNMMKEQDIKLSQAKAVELSKLFAYCEQLTN